MRSIKTVAARSSHSCCSRCVVAACGSSQLEHAQSAAPATRSARAATKARSTETLTGGKHGGTLNVLDEKDFEHLDPGIAYYALDYTVVFATQRPLYLFKPNTEPKPARHGRRPAGNLSTAQDSHRPHQGRHPLQPAGQPRSHLRRRRLRDRARRQPERRQPLLPLLLRIDRRRPEGRRRADQGHRNAQQARDRLPPDRTEGAIVADALVLPLSAPVPKEYAEKYDKNKPSDYANYQVATGPYMLKNNAEGKVLGIGYIPGKSATLVRNPNWSATTDYRPGLPQRNRHQDRRQQRGPSAARR